MAMAQEVQKKFKKVTTSVDDLSPGMLLAEDVWNSTHTQVMIGKGAELDFNLIDKLKQMDVWDVRIRVEEEFQMPEVVDLTNNVSDANENGGASANGVNLNGLANGGEGRRVSLWQKNNPLAIGSALIWSTSAARRSTVARALTPLKLAPLEAANAAEIFNQLQENAVDLLIVDLRFAEGQGWELVENLPEREGGRLPLMILSDSNSKENIIEAKKHKAKAYLIWPLEPEVLRKRISAVLGIPLP